MFLLSFYYSHLSPCIAYLWKLSSIVEVGVPGVSLDSTHTVSWDSIWGYLTRQGVIKSQPPFMAITHPSQNAPDFAIALQDVAYTAWWLCLANCVIASDNPLGNHLQLLYWDILPHRHVLLCHKNDVPWNIEVNERTIFSLGW